MGITGVPKPRNGALDQLQWISCLNKAVAEVETEYEIDVASYHGSMCSVGQKLLVNKIQTKAQSIYDYRLGKSVYRQNRKKP